MKLKIKAGTTGRLARIFVQDSSQTTGVGLTGLAYNTSGLKWYWSRVGDATATAVTPATAAVGTFTSAGFVAVDGTNMPGVYEIGVPNAALTGSTCVHMMLYGATNMTPVLVEIELDAVDYQDAAAFGLSRVDTTIGSRSTFAGGAVASVSAAVTVGTNNDKTGYALSAAGLDSVAVESGVNARQMLSLLGAESAGKLAGAGTTTITFAGANVATNRITATVDSTGNRTAVVVSPPA